jgi:cobalt-precorrin-5B (C1)-methyltransferase
MMGDHVGYAVRGAAGKGVGRLVIAGQFAKLLKVACGHEQTHASSAGLDLGVLAGWLSREPGMARLSPLAKQANTARELLELSGNDPGLVALVCGKVREYAERMAPGLKVKVLLAGYGTGVLYFE